MYLDLKNLCTWVMLQKLNVRGFKWRNNKSKFDEKFIKNYEKNNDKGYILEVDVECLKNLCVSQGYLIFLTIRMKIKKYKNLVRNLFNKKCILSLKAIKNAYKMIKLY